MQRHTDREKLSLTIFGMRIWMTTLALFAQFFGSVHRNEQASTFRFSQLDGGASQLFTQACAFSQLGAGRAALPNARRRGEHGPEGSESYVRNRP